MTTLKPQILVRSTIPAHVQNVLPFQSLSSLITLVQVVIEIVQTVVKNFHSHYSSTKASVVLMIIYPFCLSQCFFLFVLSLCLSVVLLP